MSWIRRNWMFVGFAVINLAFVAEPVSAELEFENALCDNGQGGQEYCCLPDCWIFCRCDFIE